MSLIQHIPNNHSHIMIVGEAPGREEMHQKKPFVGPEGRYFTKLLTAAGITKGDCYLTHVAHQLPKKNNIFDTIPAEAIKEGKRQLEEDIRTWQPHVIIAVGGKALEALTGKTSIFSYRGATIPCNLVPGYKVLPTVHPGNIIRGNQKYEPIVINDLAKALGESQFPEIRYPTRDVEIVRDVVDAVALLNDWSGRDEPVAADIESHGMSGNMTAYGFAPSRSHAYVITKEMLECPSVLRALSKFCDSTTPKIFHNALFDALHNGIYYNIYNRNIFFDTMIAQHAVMPVFPKSLAFCASIYTSEPYWKDESGNVFGKGAGKGGYDWEQHYIYNGKDCCLTFEIFEEIQDQISYWKVQENFQRMMGLIDPCLRAMYKGFRVNQDRVNSFSEENEKAIENLEKIKHQVIGDVNTRSTPQKKALIYDQWGLPIQKDKGKVTTSSKALEKLERFPTPQKPALGLIRNINDYLKRRDFYRLRLDKDQRIRYALKITGTYTGRMASSRSITGSGCMPLDAEAYTPDGWQKISEKPSKILQYTENGALEFAEVEWNIEDYEGSLYGYDGRCFRGLFTPNHRVIFNRRGKLYERDAFNASSISYATAPVSGMFWEGKKVDTNWIRKYVMLSADGSLEHGKWRLRVKKKPKAERAAHILGCDLPEKDKRGYYNFNAIENERFEKEFKNVESWSFEDRQTFLDELKYWDGHIRGKSYMYFTTIPKNAYTIQTIAHLTGKSASVYIDEDNSNKYGNTSTKPLYTVYVSPKSTNGIENKRWYTQHFKGKVGCPQTPSSMWLVRYDGGIHVTGNSNFQNQPKKVRQFYECEPNKIFIQMDLSQAEARVVAALCKDEKWLKEFDTIDLHSKVASQLFNIPMEKVRKQFERQTAKRVAHATHYLLGWNLLSQLLKCSAKEAKAHKATYYEIRPKLDDWHGNVRNIVKKDKRIRTCFDRVIQFPGPISDDVIRDAVAAEPQSTSADYLNNGIVRMHNEGPEDFEFNLQVHDSILGQVDDDIDSLTRSIQALKELTEIEINVRGVPLVIPTDFEIGYDWYNLIELKSTDKKEIERCYEKLQKGS